MGIGGQACIGELVGRFLARGYVENAGVFVICWKFGTEL
jgi:hypothetical protein